jgi:hypothetical protein
MMKCGGGVGSELSHEPQPTEPTEELGGGVGSSGASENPSGIRWRCPPDHLTTSSR